MTKKELIRAFKTINSFYIIGFNDCYKNNFLNSIKDLVLKDKLIIENLFFNKNIYYLEFDLKSERNWVFYENSLEIKFEYFNTKFTKIYFYVYDVNNYSGERKGPLRFSFETKIPISYITTFEMKISREFDSELNALYQIHLDNERRIWKDNLKKEIFNSK